MASTARILRKHDRGRELSTRELQLAAYCGDAASFEALDGLGRHALRAHEWDIFDEPDELAIEDTHVPFVTASRTVQLLAGRAVAWEAFQERSAFPHPTDQLYEALLAVPVHELVRPRDEIAKLVLDALETGRVVENGIAARRAVVAFARLVRGDGLAETFRTAAEDLGACRVFERAREEVLESDEVFRPGSPPTSETARPGSSTGPRSAWSGGSGAWRAGDESACWRRSRAPAASSSRRRAEGGAAPASPS